MSDTTNQEFFTEVLFTLDNIYKYASDEELAAIVRSILNKLICTEITSRNINDKELAEVVKRLRPQEYD
tara:strand:+ start:3097 stop:3303 length:207 start_codon:yes stop_codon:yes gene_type:complete